MLELVFILIPAFLIYVLISPSGAKEQQPSDPHEGNEPTVVAQPMMTIKSETNRKSQKAL